MGLGIATNTVTVNGQTAYRKNEYFRQQLVVNNTSSALWTNITVTNSGSSASGNAYVAQRSESYTYDLDGNLLSDGRWNYTWDGEDRLLSMTSLSGAPSGSLLQLLFTYDYQGRRMQKTVSTNNGSSYVGEYTNVYVYDGWNCVAVLNPSLVLSYSFLWGSDLSGSLQGAGGVGGLIKVAYYGITATNCFAAFDGNDNVSALVNAADGTTLANYEYGPFGEVIRASGPMAKLNPFRFSTKYQDDETDLLYYGCRYYNPSAGRWLSRDPGQELGAQASDSIDSNAGTSDRNLYNFVQNSPVNDFDYLGLVDVKFEVTEGGLSGWRGAAGTWGQPWWCARGFAAVYSDSALSHVTIRTRTNPWGSGAGNSCNSVDKPDPAGTIKLFLRNCPAGNFLVTIDYGIRLTATGPQGALTASLFAGGKRLVDGFGTTAQPFVADDLADFNTYIGGDWIGGDWTLVAQYTPTISIGPDHGVKSTATAVGILSLVEATKQ